MVNKIEIVKYEPPKKEKKKTQARDLYIMYGTNILIIICMFLTSIFFFEDYVYIDPNFFAGLLTSNLIVLGIIYYLHKIKVLA
ncbi:MAG: hypothetical protein ACOC22_01795 [bacterium]